ncbi:hypothetical protein M1N00_03215 [Thermodesulfovibrionales bacterium]|nr:hypothetical protein [Thermodesulfovibrionales bacterium]
MKKRHIFISLILAGLLLVLPGCIGSGVEGGPDSFITADPTVINSGETSTITAFVMTTAGTPMPDGTIVHFEATADGIILTKEAAKTVGGRAAFDLTVTLPAGVPRIDVIITATVADVTLRTTLPVIAVPLPLAVTPSTETVTGIANPDNDTSDDVTFLISGGIPDYSVRSNNPGVIAHPAYPDALEAGITSFTVDPDAVTTSTVVTLTVEDAVGTSMEVTVAVEPFVSVTLRATPSEITVLGTSSIEAHVFDGEGHPVPDGTSVSFSQHPELGEIIPSATTYRGVATATFRASNIPGTVAITGTVGDASNTVGILISPAATASIKFVSATPDVIAIRGSGGNETSLISFLVRDINGNPVVDGTLIDFVMHGPSGGRVPADGGEFIGERDDTPTKARVSTLNGVASIHLNSGSVAGTVLIIATTVDVAGITLSSASTPISVGGGVPSEKHLTVAADRFNLPGLDWAGREATISVYLADRFGNYNVLEGTSVSFYAESGAIDRSAVTDATGRTSVTFRTQLPDPVDVDPEAWEIVWQTYLRAKYGILAADHPRDGWATIMVSIRGEEAFDDADADGIFDEGESFIDTPPEAFIDVNDNELRDIAPFEIFIDDDGDRTFDMRPNAEWDSDKTIFRNISLLITGRPHYFEVRSNDITDPFTFNIPNGGYERFRVLIADRNLNHLSGGTTVSISSDEGTLAGTTSFTFPDAFTYGPKEFFFTLSDDCPDPLLRPTTITITVIHEGIAYFRTITGNIN